MVQSVCFEWRTDGGAADDAVVDRRGAVLRYLQRVVLVVRHRRVCLRRELQVQPSKTVKITSTTECNGYNHKYNQEERLQLKVQQNLVQGTLGGGGGFHNGHK